MAFNNKCIVGILVILCLALASKARVLNPRNYSKTRGFVRIKGSHFVLRHSTFLFNGFNAYWMMTVGADPSKRHQVTEVFRDASAAGMSVCRTWAFADGSSNALQLSPGTYDERVFQVHKCMHAIVFLLSYLLVIYVMLGIWACRAWILWFLKQGDSTFI